VKLLADPDHQDSAARALARIGEPAVRQVVETLDHKDANARAGAVKALALMPGRPDVLDGRLTPMLNDPDAGVRLQAAVALERLGKKNDAIVSGLKKALADPDSQVRFRAATALARLEEGAENDVPVLAAGLDDPDADDRVRALRALAELGPKSRPASGRVRELLKSDAEVRVRAAAAWTLGHVDPDEAIQPLIAALSDPEVTVRNAAADALGDIGPAAKEAIPALTEAMKPLNGREAAYQAIRKIRATKE
jgi:HEAT repeat protein